MSKTVEMVLDIDFENVCRLCLSDKGIMFHIYDDSGSSELCGRILSLASVQILPDDGLPGLICHLCRDKVEKFVRFRNQIEKSYSLLCKSIGIDPAECEAVETTNVQQENTEKAEPQADPFQLLQENFIQTDNAPPAEFVSIEQLAYPEAEIKQTEVENLLDENTLMGKEIELVSEQDLVSGLAFNIKQSVNDEDKIYNVTFPDNSATLQDLFQCLDAETDVGQSGFDDITKYLKNSPNIDFKKLKHDIKTLKVIAETSGNDDLKENDALKKLASRGVVIVQSEGLTKENDVNLALEDDELIDDEPIDFDDDFDERVKNIQEKSEILKAANMFEDPNVESREIFTETNVQEEILPRITEIVTTFLQQTNAKDGETNEGENEEELLTISKFMCHLCLSEFLDCDLEELTRHYEGHFRVARRAIPIQQNNPPFHCEICSEEFNQRKEFVIHQRNHLGVKPYICNHCHKNFTCNVKLVEHVSRHVKKEDKLLFCEHCGKTFTKKRDADCHSQLHKEIIPLMCQYCNKTFTNSITLRMHERRHKEGLKHCCELCGKSYFNKTELKRHEQVHSGVRRFPCNLCEKAFCSNAERRRHLLYHFKTKKFQCPVCLKFFYESGHVKIHMRTHTKHQPYPCEICAKSFITRGKLKRHVKMHTKLGNDEAKVKKGASNKVLPKFTKLKPAKAVTDVKKFVHFEDTNEDSQFVDGDTGSLDVLSNQEEEESYIIIEEGDNSNGDGLIQDLDGLNSVQMFTDDNGQVFYILDDENEGALQGVQLEAVHNDVQS